MKQGFFMIFEDYFSELQADMVSICLEYVQGKADKIYIYAAFEPRVSGAGCFSLLKENLYNDILLIKKFQKSILTIKFKY